MLTTLLQTDMYLYSNVKQHNSRQTCIYIPMLTTQLQTDMYLYSNDKQHNSRQTCIYIPMLNNTTPDGHVSIFQC